MVYFDKTPIFSWSRGCIPWLLMRVNWTLVSVAAANRPCHNLPEENKVRNKREGKQLGNMKYEHCQWTYLHSDPQNTPLQEQTLKEICWKLNKAIRCYNSGSLGYLVHLGFGWATSTSRPDLLPSVWVSGHLRMILMYRNCIKILW